MTSIIDDESEHIARNFALEQTWRVHDSEDVSPDPYITQFLLYVIDDCVGARNVDVVIRLCPKKGVAPPAVTLYYWNGALWNGNDVRQAKAAMLRLTYIKRLESE